MRSNRIPLTKAVQELKANIGKIGNVSEWARHMGYSRSHFCRSIKKQYRKLPKEVLAEVRLEKIKQAILEDPNAIGYKIAINAGFIDDKALYKFLTNHLGITFIEFRQEIL